MWMCIYHGQNWNICIVSRILPFPWYCVAELEYFHEDFIKWKHFPRYWPFVWRIHRSLVNSLHKGQWQGAFMCYLICASINGLLNNNEAGDLRHDRDHCGVVLLFKMISNTDKNMLLNTFPLFKQLCLYKQSFHQDPVFISHVWYIFLFTSYCYCYQDKWLYQGSIDTIAYRDHVNHAMYDHQIRDLSELSPNQICFLHRHVVNNLCKCLLMLLLLLLSFGNYV